MMLAIVQKEIEMELVTPKNNVAEEMVFKWVYALKDTVLVALVSILPINDNCMCHIS